MRYSEISNVTTIRESLSRYCEIYKTINGTWYIDLASDEYGERQDANTYGPFASEDQADSWISSTFSNPGCLNVDDSGTLPVPTVSPNGDPVMTPRQYRGW